MIRVTHTLSAVEAANALTGVVVGLVELAEDFVTFGAAVLTTQTYYFPAFSAVSKAVLRGALGLAKVAGLFYESGLLLLEEV